MKDILNNIFRVFIAGDQTTNRVQKPALSFKDYITNQFASFAHINWRGYDVGILHLTLTDAENSRILYTIFIKLRENPCDENESIARLPVQGSNIDCLKF